MKKGIFAVLVVIALVIIGTLIVKGGKSEKTLEQSVQDQSTVTDSSKMELASGSFELDTETATVQWEGRKTLIEGYVDRGTLSVQESELTANEDGLSSGSILFNMDSIKTVSTGVGGGQAGLDKHLKSADFFDVAQFPTATFEITGSEKTEVEHMYNVSGNLTMKGVTESVTIPMELFMSENGLRLIATANLDRTKWNVVYGSGSFFDNLANNVIDDMFAISFDLVAKEKVEVE